MIRISRLILISISLIVLVAACASAPATQNLAGTHWKLATLNGKAPVAAGTPVVLVFDPNNQIGGNSGCNSYGGEYTITGSKLAFAKMFSTLMSCADQSINDQEAAFNQAMSSVASFEISNGQFRLKDASGTVVLVFGKA